MLAATAVLAGHVCMPSMLPDHMNLGTQSCSYIGTAERMEKQKSVGHMYSAGGASASEEHSNEGLDSGSCKTGTA